MDLLSESLKGRLLFAIPKKGKIFNFFLFISCLSLCIGRLYEKCIELLSGRYMCK